MTATTNVQLGRATLGHLAIHYRPGDFAMARQLFEAMGAHLEDNGPDGFCTIVFDNDGWNYVDNVLYLGQATAVKLALDAAVTEALRIGAADEDPRAKAFRDMRSSSPESLDHVGIRYSNWESLERAVAALTELTGPGGVLEGRAVVTKYRARAGQDAHVDDVMATSPVFRHGDEDGTAFADYCVQVFVETDLCTTGLFAMGQTIELDYFFDPAFETMQDFGRGRKPKQ
jgi:hypothetical protein